MVENEHKPYSGDRWQYHDEGVRVIYENKTKLTPEQQAGYDAVVKAARESIKENKHRQ